jgi:hypothetical protein
MKKKARAKVDLAEDGELRKRFMHEFPIALGARWAMDCCRNMTLEGRRIEGGWPGTVPEARMRVHRELTLELAAVGLSAPTEGELAAATSTAYERARQEWQRLGRAHHVERAREKSSRVASGS